MERKIIIGLITSTEYLKQIRPIWDSMLIGSSSARLISNWCVSHFDKYEKAPGKEIETIFFQKVKEGLDKDVAEDIEEDILPSLSDESVDDDLDLDYLIPETLIYLKTQQHLQQNEQINNILESGRGSSEERLKEVEELKSKFVPINTNKDESIDLSDKSVLRAIRRAFQQAKEPVIRFPKQLGKFWNNQFIPGAFISFLGIEKRGKTFMLLDIAMRACRQGKKVAFFQAGDMNEADQLIRIGIYLTKRNNIDRYCEEHYSPVRDCINQQLDTCQKKCRETNWSPFEDINEETIREITLEELKELHKGSSDYAPCCNCKDYDNKKLGAVWLKKVEKVDTIEYKDAQNAVSKFFIENKRRFKLSTHANTTLSVNMIEGILAGWKLDGFIPDVIIIDYADLLIPSVKMEFRHQQNQIWKELRKLSQTKIGDILPLVISPTQADAPAYDVYWLQLKNFSEDKRKYGHVTAIYGLNQDSKGREKELGLMRINKLIIRNEPFNYKEGVTILQNLNQGRPVIASYFN